MREDICSRLKPLSETKMLVTRAVVAELMDGAAYGGSRAIQVRAAEDRGIPVVELQHGWIGASHGVYNFGQAMWWDELRQYLPDALLTFGDY